MNFETVDGRTIDICVEIGRDSKRFGSILFDDHTGNTVDNIIRSEQCPAENNQALLQHWLQTGRRSWADLITVLERCDLIALSRDIDDSIKAGVKQGNGELLRCSHFYSSFK